jgi:pimeloyl-ACP methyl ester carboxylesterase
VNLRNHAVEFVTSLLDALGLDSATLVGSSMGGFFALAATLAHQERVNRLVLVGYGVGMVRSVPLALRIICGIPGLSRRFMKGRPTMEAQRQQYRRMFHVDPDTIPTLHFETRIAGIQLPSAQGGDTGIPTWAALLPRVANLRGVRDEVYLGEELSTIRVPTLMMIGEHDMVSPEVARAAMARIPASRFELLSGVGHFPYLETPQRTAELIAEFLPSGSR